MRALGRIFILLAVLAIPVVVLAWLWPAAPTTVDPTPGTPKTKIRLQLNWVPEPEFGGFYAAVQDGLYSAEGLDVELIKGAAGTPSAQMAASGAVELGVVSGDQLLTLREQGGPLVAIFTVFHTSPMGLMVKKGSTWESLKDVWTNDLTVAMEAGLPYVKFLNAKFGAGKVKIVPTGTGLAAFTQGTVDAQQCFISAEPVQAELQNVPVRVFSLAEGGYDPYVVTVAANKKFFDANRDACAKFVSASREGWTRYMKNPAHYNQELAKLNTAMSVAAMDKAAILQHDLVAPKAGTAQPVGWMTAERWTTLAIQLKELGMIKSVPEDINAIFSNGPVEPVERK